MTRRANDMKVFLDTNIVLYAFGDDKKSEIARECLKNNSWIFTQVVNECSHVMRRKLNWSPARVAHELENVLTLIHLQDVTILQIRLAWKIAARFGFSHFDSVIVASALDASCDTLYSEDMQHGQLIEDQLRIINPFIEPSSE